MDNFVCRLSWSISSKYFSENSH